jgi:tetratricopeptide (TPR) repeat protein
MKKVFPLIFILCFTAGFAQTSIDSLLKKANFELYENPAHAIEIGQKILNAKNAKQVEKVEALLLISTGYSSERNYSRSLEYAVQAAQLIPQIDDDRFKIIIYSRLGLQYQQLKIYDKAHSYLDKAIEISQQTKNLSNIHKLLGFNNAIRAMVYKEQMSCEIAQNYFNKSLYHYRKSEKESLNYANVSVIVYNKGNCFLSLNQIDSARICFTDSYDFASKIDANSLKAFAYKGLAEVNTLEGKYDNAIRLLLDASKMSQDVGDLVLNQGIYKGLADNYLVTNNIAQHEIYRRKYDQTTARIKNNNSKTINELILEVNSESDNEIAQVQSEALYYKIPLVILILLLLLALWFENRRYRKKFKILKAQREILENRSSAKA